MLIRHQKLATCLTVIVTLFGCWSSVVFAGYAHQQHHLDTSSIGARTYSAGFVGNYAGHLTGGHAVSELLHEQASSEHDNVESHDFSDDHGASSSLHESLGSLGDHLEGHSFPADVEGEHYKSDVGATAADYAEVTSASEHYAEVESLGHDHHYNEVELGHHEHHFEDSGSESLHGDYESKPVTGIDHGKGAFSYSTLYESKEHEYQH